ncbi:MAG: hypothetical protein HOW97_20990, partial [Catenulispora sp.]|nr:hypothetical protein [Catenulispora sp.]
MIDVHDEGWPPQRDLSDRQQVWEFVRSYAAAFGWPLVDGDGVEPAELDAAATRLGRGLPLALCEAYLLFGRRRDLTASQDTLLSPERLNVDPSRSVLVYRHENQACAAWGVRLAELELDDPPVVMDLGNGWVPYSERLSVAMAEMVLSESMLSEHEASTTDNCGLDDRTRSMLEADFDRLGLPDLPFWAAPDGPPVRWFQGPDVLLRDDGGQWLWVHGRSSAAVDAVRDRLPSEWQMVP